MMAAQPNGAVARHGGSVGVAVDHREQYSLMRKALKDLDSEDAAVPQRGDGGGGKIDGYSIKPDNIDRNMDAIKKNLNGTNVNVRSRVMDFERGNSDKNIDSGTYDRDMDAMKKNLKGAQVRSRVLEATVEASRKKITALEDQLKQTIEKNGSLQNKLGSETMSSLEMKANLESTKQELDRIKGQYDQLTSKNQKHDTMVLKLKNSEASHKTALRSVKQELIESTKRLNATIKKCEDQESKISSLSVAQKKAELDSEKNKETMKTLKHQFVKEIQYWKKLNEELYKSNLDKIQEIEIVKEERDNLIDSSDIKEAKIHQLTDQVFQLETTASEQVAELEAKNKSKERRLNALINKYQTLSDKKAALLEQASVAEETIEGLQKERDELTTTVELLAKENKSCCAKISEFELLTKELAEEKESMNKLLEDSSKRRLKLEGHLKNNKEGLTNQVSEWKSRYEEAMSLNETLRAELGKHRQYNKDQVIRFMEIEMSRHMKAANFIEEHFKIGEDHQLQFSMYALPRSEYHGDKTSRHTSTSEVTSTDKAKKNALPTKRDKEVTRRDKKVKTRQLESTSMTDKYTLPQSKNNDVKTRRLESAPASEPTPTPTSTRAAEELSPTNNKKELEQQEEHPSLGADDDKSTASTSVTGSSNGNVDEWSLPSEIVKSEQDNWFWP